MKQQALKLEYREAQNRSDYIVGLSNIDAIKWIDKYPEWGGSGLIIVGPKSCGKSHLVSVWQKKSKCNVYTGDQINTEDVNVTDNKNLAVEDLEKIKNFEFLLHLINYKKENNFKFLLTCNQSILSLDINLNDIKSRLLELPKVEISLPTDEIIRGLMLKLLKDKGIFMNKKLIDYIVVRVERSYEAINKFINNLNKISLEKKSDISLSIIKKALEHASN